MTNERKLEEQIELAVGEYLRASQEAASLAVQRAFSKVGTPTTHSRSGRVSSQPTKHQNRRSAADLAILREELIAAVHTHPGETMRVLATHVGVRAMELQSTVVRLKREGSLRMVGKRRFARYFPATETAQEKAA